MTTNNKQGTLLSFEGISGCGKSTLIKRWLAPFLKERGVNCIYNAEPTSANAFGIAIRKAIERQSFEAIHIKNLMLEIVRLFKVAHALGKDEKLSQYFYVLAGIPEKLENGERLSELERQFLFLADSFFDVTDTITPALEEGLWVLQDRFHFSGPAYGSAKGELTIKEIYDWRPVLFRARHIVPDLTFFIDVSPETAVQRLKISGKVIDLYEGSESLRKIKIQYEEALRLISVIEQKQNNVVRLNGEFSANAVFEEAMLALKERGLV